MKYPTRESPKEGKHCPPSSTSFGLVDHVKGNYSVTGRGNCSSGRGKLTDHALIRFRKATGTRYVVIEPISSYECNLAESVARVDTRYMSLELAPTGRHIYASAITSYTHTPWHRRYFLNRELPYWLPSSITCSAFRGFILILQNNSMLKDTNMFRSRMGAFSCIDSRYSSRLRNRIR